MITRDEIVLTREVLGNGRVFISSTNLPGFMLVVHPNESESVEVRRALDVFYPLYVSTESRRKPYQEKADAV